MKRDTDATFIFFYNICTPSARPTSTEIKPKRKKTRRNENYLRQHFLAKAWIIKKWKYTLEIRVLCCVHEWRRQRRVHGEKISRDKRDDEPLIWIYVNLPMRRRQTPFSLFILLYYWRYVNTVRFLFKFRADVMYFWSLWQGIRGRHGHWPHYTNLHSAHSKSN